MTTSANSSEPAAFNLAAVPKGREDIARLIVKTFADAGFGKPQQLAALANAIVESGLNPEAAAVSENSFGLFQISRRHLGAGHTVEELEDPNTNTILIAREAKKVPVFASAATLQDAVDVFVRMIMRPADVAGQVAHRLKIAESLATSA